MPLTDAQRKDNQRKRDADQGMKRHEVRIPNTPEAIHHINLEASILREAHKADISELLGEQE